MRIDTDGNVGIGTDSPTALLHIKKNIAKLLSLDRTDNALVNDIFNFSVSAISGIGDDYMSIGTAGFPNTLVTTGTGNVGVGTNNPLKELDVRGNMQIRAIADGSNTFLVVLGRLKIMKAMGVVNSNIAEFQVVVNISDRIKRG